MQFQGELQVLFEQRPALFRAIARLVAPDTARLAFWWLTDSSVPEWSLPMEAIGAESPFPESGSILGGSGRLVELTPQNIEAFLSSLKPDALRDLIHLEVQSKGRVQFAAYDFFEHVFFGLDIDTSLLDTWRAQGLIRSYALY